MTSVIGEHGEAAELDLTAPRPVPWGGVVARLRASSALRRLVPAPVAMTALDLLQRVAVARNPARLEAARDAMLAVVGGTPLESDLDRLAVRHLSAWSHGWEVMWRPWLLRSMPIEGAEALDAIEAGRGIVFTGPHFGPLVGIAPLPALVGPLYAAVGDHQVMQPPAGYNGYQLEQLRTVLRLCGIVPVRAQGSARTFARVLQGGGRVFLNLDVPGKTPIQFLGKSVEMASGSARLAQTTDSVVVPVVPLPHGRKWHLHLGTPLDSRDFTTWEELLQAAAAAVEGFVLRAPEHLETPLRDGGWAVATRDGWRKSA